MCKDRILGYAVEFAVYIAGTGYGQSGNAPAGPEECSPELLDHVRRAVSQGRKSGTAREQGDEARAQFERDYFRKCKPLAKLIGVHEFLEECFSIGYRSVRTH